MTCPYAEQLEADRVAFISATGITPEQHIKALQVVIEEQVRAAEFLLADHGLPIPWPAPPAH